MSIRSILLFIFAGCSLPALATENTGFDEICTIYTEAVNSSMPVTTASEYILSSIQHRVSSQPALQAHQAMMEAMGDARYSLFKSFAEHELNRSWNCGAMKQMLGKRIDPAQPAASSEVGPAPTQ